MQKRRIGYGVAGVLLGVIVYLFLLTQIPEAAIVKTTLSEFDTQTSEFENPDDNDNFDYEEGDQLAQKPFLEFGSYHVSIADYKNYEEKGIVKYGKANPMYYYIHHINPVNPVNPVVPDTDNSDDNKDDEHSKTNDNVFNGKGGKEDNYQLGFNLLTGKEDLVEISSILAHFKQYARMPIDGELYNITSGFGSRVDPFSGNNAIHTGIDIASVGIDKTNVYSAVNGTIIETISNPTDTRGYGNYVVVQHDGYQTLYGHLDSIADIKPGDDVFSGTIIGKVGNTGRSTGPHLHFEVRQGSVALNSKLFIEQIRKEER